MKADRKRLSSEKADLVSQIKQLYNTLKDKEAELRDFIRNYEQRTKDNNELIKQVNNHAATHLYTNAECLQVYYIVFMSHHFQPLPTAHRTKLITHWHCSLQPIGPVPD